MSRGFGVAAGLDPEVAAPLATRCAELGYSSMWSNDHPGALGLETVKVFADAAPGVELGVAVMALDRHDPKEINGHIERLGIDRDRLWLGVGAGLLEAPADRDVASTPRPPRADPRGPPGARRDGAEDVQPRRLLLRRRVLQLDDARSSPRRLGSTSSGAPATSRASRRPCSATSGSRSARTRASRLTKEESFYRDLHDGYRNHFERLGEPEGTVGVAAADRDEAQLLLAAYTALDVTVVRGLASATVEAMSAVAEASAP